MATLDRPDQELADLLAKQAHAILQKDPTSPTASTLATLALFHQLKSGNQRAERQLAALNESLSAVTGGMAASVREVRQLRESVEGLRWPIQQLRRSFGFRLYDSISLWWWGVSRRWTPRPPWIDHFKTVTKPERRPLPLHALDALSGVEFEKHVVGVLENLGWSRVEHNGGAGDHGVDILASHEGHVLAIQCKRYAVTKQHPSREVQQFAGGASRIHNADALVFVTTSQLTSGATKFAEKANVTVIDRAGLEAWLREGRAPEALIAPGFEPEETRLVGAGEDRTVPPPDKPRFPIWTTLLLMTLGATVSIIGSKWGTVQVGPRGEEYSLLTLSNAANIALVACVLFAWLRCAWLTAWWRKGVEKHWPDWAIDEHGTWNRTREPEDSFFKD